MDGKCQCCGSAVDLLCANHAEETYAETISDLESKLAAAEERAEAAEQDAQAKAEGWSECEDDIESLRTQIAECEREREQRFDCHPANGVSRCGACVTCLTKDLTECERERDEWKEKAQRREEQWISQWRNNVERDEEDDDPLIRQAVEAIDSKLRAWKDRDAALARERVLHGALDELKDLDAHGCGSGDCPHEIASDCVVALFGWIEEAAEIARAALSEGCKPCEHGATMPLLKSGITTRAWCYHCGAMGTYKDGQRGPMTWRLPGAALAATPVEPPPHAEADCRCGEGEGAQKCSCGCHAPREEVEAADGNGREPVAATPGDMPSPSAATLAPCEQNITYPRGAYSSSYCTRHQVWRPNHVNCSDCCREATSPAPYRPNGPVHLSKETIDRCAEEGLAMRRGLERGAAKSERAEVTRLRGALRKIDDRAGHCLAKQGHDADGCVRLVCGLKCREVARTALQQQPDAPTPVEPQVCEGCAGFGSYRAQGSGGLPSHGETCATCNGTGTQLATSEPEEGGDDAIAPLKEGSDNDDDAQRVDRDV